MGNPPLDPDVADTAPTEPTLTDYDRQHFVTYLRLLDADSEGADWREVARIVLHIDPDREPERARTAFDSHLARAKWMTEHGYRHVLRGGGYLKQRGASVRPVAMQRLYLEVAYNPPCNAQNNCFRSTQDCSNIPTSQ